MQQRQACQETCPFRTLFVVVQDTAWKGQDVEPPIFKHRFTRFELLFRSKCAPGVDMVRQDMLVLKYGLELDELDFINKAKAVMLQP